MDEVPVCIVDIGDSRAAAAEATLDAAGFALPLSSRVAWGKHFGASTHELAIATGADGQAIAAIGVESTRTRALPAHWIVRVHALEDAFATSAGRALIAGIAEYGASRGRVLEVVVELECREEASRELLRDVLASLRFRERPAQRVAARTLALELADSEDSIFASFSESTRNKLRKVAKLGIELDLLADPCYSDRMNAMLADTFARTGARTEPMNWQAVMSICASLPHRSRLVGVFNGARRTPEDLIAYAWGIHDGERAVYHTGASVIVPGTRLPVMYPAMWDLIRWAKREGAHWFDFGGVTRGAEDQDDALGGISDFKRRFCRNEIAMGEEWSYEPSRTKARIARFAGDSVRWLSGLR